ncbi:MAG TPA: amidohydrolase family protein [Roseiflexaceae bacterium]|nr:amidohydrolase family protein [Roseiflexaceae bacterium]
MANQGAAHNTIDCDVHNVVPSVDVLLPYLSDYWREFVLRTDFKGPIESAYPISAATSLRPDATPPDGPPGSSLELLRAQSLDAWNVDFAILNCDYVVESLHNPYGAAALASAVNDWLLAEWLEREPRLRASLIVPSHHPDLAAQEIERMGAHPGFVQVLLPVRSGAPYGSRQYHPLFAAVERHGLAVGLHFGGAPGLPPTSSGWPSYYVEEYAGMAQIFQSQLLSMIVEGTFAQFPELRVALLESGVTWLPSFLWRADKEWKGLRSEVPWVRKRPSEYIHEHVRLSTAPFDAPPDAQQLTQIVEQLGSDELLMFSTDYPHWQFETPEEAFPHDVPPDLARKIMSENARAFYRLGAPAA